MGKANSFEQAHHTELQNAEKAALEALQAIAADDANAPAVRVEAAKVILSVRSEDA